MDSGLPRETPTLAEWKGESKQIIYGQQISNFSQIWNLEKKNYLSGRDTKSGRSVIRNKYIKKRTLSDAYVLYLPNYQKWPKRIV